MAVDVHERFLSNAKKRRGPIFREVAVVTITIEPRCRSGPLAEAADQAGEGTRQVATVELRGPMEKRQRTDLLVDPADGLLNIVDQLVVPGASIVDPEASDAEMKGDEQLAGAVMEFLSEALALVIVGTQQVIDQLGPVAIEEHGSAG